MTKNDEDTPPRFLIFDGRARFDIDRAAVLSCAYTVKEAIGDLLLYDNDAIVYDCERHCLRHDFSRRVQFIQTAKKMKKRK